MERVRSAAARRRALVAAFAKGDLDLCSAGQWAIFPCPARQGAARGAAVRSGGRPVRPGADQAKRNRAGKEVRPPAQPGHRPAGADRRVACRRAAAARDIAPGRTGRDRPAAAARLAEPAGNRAPPVALSRRPAACSARPSVPTFRVAHARGARRRLSCSPGCVTIGGRSG